MTDNEAVSLCAKSVNRVEKSLNQCLRQNKQLDTFAVDHLFMLLCKVYACMSPSIALACHILRIM